MASRGRKRVELRLGIDQVTAGNGHGFVDRFGLRRGVVLEGMGREVLDGMLAGAGLRAIARRIRRVHGIELGSRDLTAFVEDLRGRAIFEDERARREREEAFARHVASGTLFLPTGWDAPRMREDASRALERARAEVVARLGPIPSVCRLEGALSPHGEIAATGRCAALAWSLLTAEQWPHVFVIVGTSHFDPEPAILTHDVVTPLGRIRCDRDAAREIARGLGTPVRENAPSLLVEHSWQQDLPLLQVAAESLDRPLAIVAIAAGEVDRAAGERLGATIARVLFDQRKRGCLIASGDLTHFGAGVRWTMDGLSERGLRVAEVARRIEEFERPILSAIEARDADAFFEAAPGTSFCARPQVAALLAFTTARGVLLGRQAVLNGKPLQRAPERLWRSRDSLFVGASLAFFSGGPGTERSGPRLCREVLLRADADMCEVVHPCDNTSFQLPGAAAPVAVELQEGAAAAELRTRLLYRWAIDVDPAELDETLRAFDEAGWLHAAGEPAEGPSRSLLEQARVAIRRARVEVPHYRETLTSDDLSDAPFIRSAQLADGWRAFLVDGSGRSLKDKKRYVRLKSSGSTSGRWIDSPAELADWRDREASSLLVRGVDVPTLSASVNRPSNLGLKEPKAGWPAHRQGDRVDADAPGASEWHALSPGPNPTRVTPEVWDRTIRKLLEIRPRVLEGDGSYLAGLARRCLALGVRLEGVERVFFGHSYAWELYRDPIRRAFGAPLSDRLITSEAHVLGVDCWRGALHLLEPHTVFEVVDRGRHVRAGELGALVLTTLDNRIRPLIRYANGDVVRLLGASCPCARPFRPVRYEGRVRHLFAGRSGEPVTYRAIDEAIGAPVGLAYFRLTVGEGSARLQVVPTGARELLDTRALAARVEETIARRVRIAWVDHLEIASAGGKFLSIATKDESDRWYARLLDGARARRQGVDSTRKRA
jgi:AmmeMemoRadiSam system protein B